MNTKREFEVSGILVEDPDKGLTSYNKPFAKAVIAVTENYTTRNGEDRSTTYYFEVSAYGGDALQTLSNAHRGQNIEVKGRLSSKEKQGRDGGKFYNYYLNASEVIVEEPQFNTGPVDLMGDDLPF